MQQNLVSTTQPNGSKVTKNSDLQLAATIILHTTVCHTYNVRKQETIHRGTNNQAAQQAWQQKGSTTTNTVPAFLLQLQAIHQCFHCYILLHS
jgi:hypothetical protein